MVAGEVTGRRVLARGIDGAGAAIGISAGHRPGYRRRSAIGKHGRELLNSRALLAGAIAAAAIGVDGACARRQAEARVAGVGGYHAARATGYAEQDGRQERSGQTQPESAACGTSVFGFPFATRETGLDL